MNRILGLDCFKNLNILVLLYNAVNPEFAVFFKYRYFLVNSTVNNLVLFSCVLVVNVGTTTIYKKEVYNCRIQVRELPQNLGLFVK